MFDVKRAAKDMLKKKGKGKGSKLDVYDLQDLLVYAMLDGTIDSVEMQGLKDIKRYTYGNMTEDAVKVYNGFMEGLLGKRGSIGLRIDFPKTIEAILARNVQNGLQKMIYPRQITYLLYEIIHDGYVSKNRMKALFEMLEYKKSFSADALEIFTKFAIAYEKEMMKRFPKEPAKKPGVQKRGRSSSTKVHDLSPDAYRQCGTCAGSGQTTCSSCYGMGGRSETRMDYDWDGTPIYREEFIPCMCNGGYTTCGTCGGSGSVYK
ncbi:MAG: hypothetical protein D6732_02010 [Methanobacteriota archaeon]|nr:MAG: hypothetical protein D6732_02010 [Euryarchaeota archaeon]